MTSNQVSMAAVRAPGGVVAAAPVAAGVLDAVVVPFPELAFRSGRAERQVLSQALREQGGTWVQIAQVFMLRYRANARVALRWAHCLSQSQVADRWCRRWPDQPVTYKKLSYWEVWPAPSGHEPRLDTLVRLAELYQCAVGDLLADLPDYTSTDKAHPAHGCTGDGLEAAAVGMPHPLSCAHVLRVQMVYASGAHTPLPVGLLTTIAAAIIAHCGHCPLKAFRLAYHWTVTRAVNELHAMCQRQRQGERGLVDRSWKEWEAGSMPSDDHRDLLCRLFQTGPIELGFATDYTPPLPAPSPLPGGGGAVATTAATTKATTAAPGLAGHRWMLPGPEHLMPVSTAGCANGFGKQLLDQNMPAERGN